MLLIPLAFAVVLGGGCGGSDSRDLDATARSILPPSVRVAGREEGDCVELPAFPSCVLVLFAFEGRPDVSDRARVVQETAEEKGWRLDWMNAGPGGIGLGFERDGYRADFALWNDPRRSCGAIASLKTCAAVVDHVQVIRD
jgi:hypothetical protein